MRHHAPRRQLPTAVLVRWLALCLPVGLYHLWRQHRWNVPIKLGISAVSTLCGLLTFVAILTMLSNPAPVEAQTSAALLMSRDIYPLVADPDGGQYHLEGCVYAPENALPVTLRVAAQQHMQADERCNPPRHTVGQ